ncbi:hypothetical protein EVAR_57062_1 [Eumeta japonica]|uniref:Retrovirus-related Pol polyprotein from type-1 retrotransposable element R1 n=1 Tax=Eumeta variegata TaxID=151549 RepID=A0A4C1YTD9_EUMVA|nr:hypothetical protein EVAR_57062_1 [Eumeta japonica]
MAGRRGDLVLDAMTRSLPHGFPDGHGSVAQSYTKDWSTYLVTPATTLEDSQKKKCRGKHECDHQMLLASNRAIATGSQTDQNDVPKAQILTGHDGFAQYLFRFKLRGSPYCICDPAKFQDVLHIFEDCDMFHRERVALKTEVDVRTAR